MLAHHRDAQPDFFRFFLATLSQTSPYVMVLRDAQGASMAVGRTSITRLQSRFGYFSVSSPQLRILELVHGGLLGEAESRHAPAIIAHIRSLLLRGEVDGVRLHYARVDTGLFTAFCGMRGFLGRHVPAQTVEHWSRTVEGSRASFTKTISRNERSNQRRRERRLLEACEGALRIVRYDSAKDMESLIEDAERVASRSYQRGIGVGFVDSDVIRSRLAFYAERGWLRAWLLYMHASPVAMWIGAATAGTFFSDYLAYDARLSHLAPGTYLTMRVLEELQDSSPDIRRIDFGPGEASYKARFGTDKQVVATVDVFAPTPAGVYARILQITSILATISVNRTLRRFGMLGWIKRNLRKRATPDFV